MENQHLLSAGRLLSEEGNLAEAGYAFDLVKTYSRSDIKAPTAPFCKKIADPEKMLLKAYASKAGWL